MDRLHNINSRRILWCCDELNISPEQLAADTNISYATLERVLESGSGLTFKQLSRVAKYFGRGVLFFLEDGPVGPAAVYSSDFRTLANQKPQITAKVRRIIEQTERQRDFFVSLRENFIEAEDLPRFAPPEVAGLTIDQAADVVRAWLGLGRQNTFESYRAAVEKKGILVFRSNGYNGKWQIPKESPILGFSLYSHVCPVIVVKKQRWPARQTFTLMHELGHLLLHRASSIDDEQDLWSRHGWEQEANAFAGRVLVPDAYLSRIDDSFRPHDVSEYDEWLTEYRRAWGVSGEVILRRLLDAGRLPSERYSAYREWWQRQEGLSQEDEGGSRLYRHREPRHIFGDTFVRAVLNAVNARQLTLTRASNYLDGIKVRDLHLLERHYAGL